MTDAAPIYGHRLARWQERSELPLAGVAVVFLAAYAWPILEPGCRTRCAVPARRSCSWPGACSLSTT